MTKIHKYNEVIESNQITSMAKEYNLKITERDTEFKQVKLTGSDTVIEFTRNFYHDDIEIYESMFLILLNRSNIITGYVKISTGGVAGVIADPVIIAKYAVDTLSSSVILVHNHPSGNMSPSIADRNITNKIKKGLGFFNINLMDHLIITKDSHKSIIYD